MTQHSQRPNPAATSLEAFDPLALLFMLGRSGRSGTLSLIHPRGELKVGFRAGKVQLAEMEGLRGPAALAAVVRDPQGSFSFDEHTPVQGALNLSVEALALAALRELPSGTELFPGPARLAEGVEPAQLGLNPTETRALQQLQSGRPLSQLTGDPETRALAARLIQLGLLVARKARVARLTLGLERTQSRSATLDASILARWSEDTGRPVTLLELRTEAGQVHKFSVRPHTALGNTLLLPRELLIQHGLRAGESVLVRPG